MSRPSHYIISMITFFLFDVREVFIFKWIQHNWIYTFQPYTITLLNHFTIHRIYERTYKKILRNIESPISICQLGIFSFKSKHVKKKQSVDLGDILVIQLLHFHFSTSNHVFVNFILFFPFDDFFLFLFNFFYFCIEKMKEKRYLHL